MKYLPLILLAISFNSFAGATYSPLQTEHSIITPSVATGFRGFERFNNDTLGNMVVCLHENWGNLGSCNKWTLVQDVVPKGRTFVGIRVSHKAYGYRILEVWWK